MASLVAAKDKVFINQTKLLHEVTWKTVMQIAKKHAKSAVVYLQRICDNQKSERIFIDWCWWILGALPFPHLGELRCANVARDMKLISNVFFRYSSRDGLFLQRRHQSIISRIASNSNSVP
jgi:hypothetical protein